MCLLRCEFINRKKSVTSVKTGGAPTKSLNGDSTKPGSTKNEQVNVTANSSILSTSRPTLSFLADVYFGMLYFVVGSRTRQDQCTNMYFALPTYVNSLPNMDAPDSPSDYAILLLRLEARPRRSRILEPRNTRATFPCVPSHTLLLTCKIRTGDSLGCGRGGWDWALESRQRLDKAGWSSCRCHGRLDEMGR